MKFILPILTLCVAITGCAWLTKFQSYPQTQFAETEAIKLAAQFFSNGGQVDNAWGIAEGINVVSDIVTASQAKVAPQTVAQAVHDFASNPTAVNGLANGVAAIIVKAAPQTPAQTAAVVQAVASGIQKATAANSP